MRDELEEIQQIDQYLFCRLGEEEKGVFEARLLQNEGLAETVEAQRVAHRLIRRYGRAEVRRQLEAVYSQLLEEPAFAHQIKTIFF